MISKTSDLFRMLCISSHSFLKLIKITFYKNWFTNSVFDVFKCVKVFLLTTGHSIAYLNSHFITREAVQLYLPATVLSNDGYY